MEILTRSWRNHKMKIRYIILLTIPVILGAELFSQNSIGYPRFMQGPMMGAVGPNEITIWGRLNGTFSGEIEYDTAKDFSQSKKQALAATKEEDYVLKWKLTGLNPDTRYYYRFKVEGSTPSEMDGENWTVE